ncbi:MAG TPA: N-acetylmuramoyl-L-alanine amidase [Alphaproteobacteria bacterium]|nr:N-acetylmuramoyl-L-alanine amidase [Alphaproteobacteria bacterium]
MRVINKHIIHCSDSEVGDVKLIRQWHIERGWQDVGYHFIIRRDGEIEVGRTLEEMGAHCQGQNADSIGTCLVGVRDFTPGQFAALKRVHGMVRSLFPGVRVFNHCQFNAGKTCPNFDAHDILGE